MSEVGNIVVKVDNTKLVGEALKRAILAGLEEIGLDCEHIASENAPYDTGRLSASITHVIDAGEPAVYGTLADTRAGTAGRVFCGQPQRRIPKDTGPS